MFHVDVMYETRGHPTRADVEIQCIDCKNVYKQSWTLTPKEKREVFKEMLK